MGHNDTGSSLATHWTNIDNFGAAYAKLVDDLHAALPEAHIICQGMMATSGGQRVGGDKILEVCNDPARNTYAASIDAQGWIPGYGATGTNMADTVHPNDAGNVFYATKADEVLKTLNADDTTFTITDGDNNFTEGQSTGDLEFTIPDTSTDDNIKLVNRLVDVVVDGETLTLGADYTVREGSVIISLTQSFLNTLAAGTYNLTANFTGNVQANGQFIVLADATGGGNNGGNNNGNNGGNNGGGTNNGGGANNPSAPNAGLFGIGSEATVASIGVLTIVVALGAVLIGRKLMR
jgi:hypothetical protein